MMASAEFTSRPVQWVVEHDGETVAVVVEKGGEFEATLGGRGDLPREWRGSSTLEGALMVAEAMAIADRDLREGVKRCEAAYQRRMDALNTVSA